MGNTSASKLKETSAPPPETVTAEESIPSVDTLPNVVKFPCSDYSQNPGCYEELFRKYKEITPMCFDGAKLIINKTLSTHFQVTHSMILGTSSPSSFRFGASYVGTHQYLPHEVFPVLIGDIDANGSLNANAIHQWNENLRTKLILQIEKNKLAGFQATSDIRYKRSMLSINAININVLRNQGLFVLQYLQKVSKNLDLGTEYYYQYGEQLPAKHVGMVSFGGKYSAREWSVSASINPSGLVHVGYFHQKPRSPIQFGAELEANLSTMESIATFGYQVDLAKANCTFKASADSNWTCGAVLEKRLLPLPFTFILSGQLNHLKQVYKFGFGLIVG